MEKPNIIIVDDHLIFRQGLINIMYTEDIATVIGDASNGKEFMELLTHLNPDLVLMDIDMPYMNGMEATRKALEINPELKIIAVTMFGDEEYYYKMIDLGVKGFILKTSGINEIEKAIHEVMMGESYFSNELLRKIINSIGREKKSKTTPKPLLSDRELEVLKLICNGDTTDEIAQKLFISPKTVKSHRSHLLEKTECKNTPEMIVFAVKNRYISL